MEPRDTNPNAAAIQEYGRIEWHGATARLVAGGSRPLDMAALTMSTCLDLAVNSEDPTYRFPGDMLDTTAPQWLIQHPEKHGYAAKPGVVDITFAVGPDGLPSDATDLLMRAVRQVNDSEPYSFRVNKRELPTRTLYTFEPTRTHDEKGLLVDQPSPMSEMVSIPRSEKVINLLADELSQKLSEQTGLQFSCCQSMIIGQPWGGKSIAYEAANVPAREVMEDLITQTGGDESYAERCEPFDKRFCVINVHNNANRAKPPSGVCTAAGYSGE